MRRRLVAPLSSAALLTAIALLAPPRAQAHDNGLYVSFKYGTTDVDASIGDAFDQVVDGDDDSQAIEAGYRWSRFFAVQVGYHDFGEIPGLGTPCDEDDEVCIPVEVPIESESTAWSLSLVPQLPLGNRFSVFGKVGAVALETEIDDVGDALDFFEDEFSEEDVIWGVGLRLQIIGPIQVFYEYEGIGDDYETQSFGATWQF
jgi:hypothetical protein